MADDVPIEDAKLLIKVEGVSKHRNGTDGVAFHVVLFQAEGRKLFGVVFEKAGHVAVMDRELLYRGMFEYRKNSWVGYAFEGALRQIIKQWDENKEGTVH